MGRVITPPPVHPHACGDDSLTGRVSSTPIGSPPRVWGRPAAQSSTGPGPRFTPTRVGTTNGCWPWCARETVHPHACGDDRPPGVRASIPFGSPPRVWGRPQRERQRVHPLRFTPTRVGTTGAIGNRARKIPVHPHACGDDADSWSFRAGMSGSPPRVWGRLPARYASATPPTVHPHACGDDSESLPSARMVNGSPPRVWGRHPVRPAARDDRRFTPTRVGTTR